MWGKIFKKDERVVGRKIADEKLLVPIRGKLADMQRIFALNPVAEYIWEQLDGEKSLAEIREELLEEFAVERKQAEADMLEFIDELQQAELIMGVE